MSVPDGEQYHISMSEQLHEYVRHTIDCKDGHVQEKLTAIADQIRSEIGPKVEGRLEDPVTFQRRLELSYIEGYLDGPGAAVADIAYDQDMQEEHRQQRLAELVEHDSKKRGKRQ